MRKLISLISAILFAFTAPTVLATGGHNPPPPKPTPPPTQSVDVEQRVNVGVGVNTHTSSSAGATSGSHSSAAGGNASASGGHSAATVGNVTATGGQGGAGGSSSSSSSAAGGAGGSVGNIDAGSGNGNTVNIGGDTISYPRQNPGAIAAPLPPVVCAKSGTSVSISSPVVSIAFSSADSEARCFQTAEANSCVAAAVSAASAFGLVRPLRPVAVRCLTRLPVMIDIAKDLGLTPDGFANEILRAAAGEDATEARLAAERAAAEKAASANALAEAKARADQLAVELAAAREANSRINKILENERARKPLVVTRPAAKPPLTSGQVELELRLKSTCKTDCPPQQPQK